MLFVEEVDRCTFYDLQSGMFTEMYNYILQCIFRNCTKFSVKLYAYTCPDVEIFPHAN